VFFIHVTAHFVNSGISMNFTKEYVNIILAIIAVLLYVYLLLCIFNIVDVKLMY